MSAPALAAADQTPDALDSLTLHHIDLILAEYAAERIARNDPTPDTAPKEHTS